MQNKVLLTFFFSFFRKKFYFTLTFLFLFSFFGLAMVQLLTRLKRRLDPRLSTSGVCVCLFFFLFFFFFFFFRRSAFTVYHCLHIVHAFKNIKNKFYGIIYIFKNYFTTVFSVFNFQ